MTVRGEIDDQDVLADVRRNAFQLQGLKPNPAEKGGVSGAELP